MTEATYGEHVFVNAVRMAAEDLRSQIQKSWEGSSWQSGDVILRWGPTPEVGIIEPYEITMTKGEWDKLLDGLIANPRRIFENRVVKSEQPKRRFRIFG